MHTAKAVRSQVRQKGKYMEFIAYVVVPSTEIRYPEPRIMFAEEPSVDLYNETLIKLLVKTDYRTTNVDIVGGFALIERARVKSLLYYDWKNNEVVDKLSEHVGATAKVIEVKPEENVVRLGLELQEV